MFQRRILTYLKEWKDKNNRKPLILRGARQVGKTESVLMFGEKHYENVIHLNLERAEHIRLFRKDMSLEEFVAIIEIQFDEKIIPGATLIFIDEIQNSFPLAKLLRFFYEDSKDFHVIAAGSLLEAFIEKEGFSFPVGRVEFAYLYPLDFFEFLEAKGKVALLDYLRGFSFDKEIPAPIHEEALRRFYEYAMIGGMPEIVREHVEGGHGPGDLKTIYASLFTGYMEDIYKYSSRAGVKYLRHVIENAPFFAGSLITYHKFAGSNFRGREMGRAFDTLEKIMLLCQVRATKSTRRPIVGQPKRPRKLLFLDVGLVNFQMDIQREFWDLKELADFYRGRIAEQVVGQNILAQFVHFPPQIHYWARDKREGIAEVDFCVAHEGKIWGLEVKSGSSKKLKSLFSFARSVSGESRLIRIYSGNFSAEHVSVARGDRRRLVSIPFYLAPRALEA